jgi:hypothetical protein
MNVPYTTPSGVKIGLQYIANPKPHQILDEDMLLLQQALLTRIHQHSSLKDFIADFITWIRS